MSEVGASVRGNNSFRSRVPIVPFTEGIRGSREFFADNSPMTEAETSCHQNTKAATGYHQLRLRGFLIQGSLDPNNHSLDAVLTLIARIGWLYTVVHVNPFCPNVVREFVSNKPYNVDDALIRGRVFRFTPAVINKLMMTPPVSNSFLWKDVELNLAIAYLTGWQHLCWKGFNLNAMRKPFQTLYRVCELNWLPGPYSDLIMKDRLRLLYAVATQKQISFGHMVYDQVIEMVRLTDSHTDIIFPNLIYDVLLLQNQVPVFPVDEAPIGKDLPIYGDDGNTSGPRGSRRMY